MRGETLVAFVRNRVVIRPVLLTVVVVIWAAWALALHLPAQAEVEGRRVGYQAEVKLLYGLLHFESTGTIDEAVDRTAGRYEVHVVGEGSAITSKFASWSSISRACTAS